MAHKTRHGVRVAGSHRSKSRRKPKKSAKKARAVRRKRKRHHAGAHRAAMPPSRQGTFRKFRVKPLMERSTWAEHEVPYKLTQVGSPPFGYDKWNIRRLRRAAKLTDAANVAQQRLNVAQLASIQNNQVNEQFEAGI